MELPPGYFLDARKELDSTNEEAHRQWAQGRRGPGWIRAVRQSRGRGRHGRAWASPAGNLYATLLWSGRVGLETAGQISLVAALAMRDAVLALLPAFAPKVTLKWPNDLLLDGAKVSGILAETLGTDAEGLLSVAVGCGLNLASSPTDTPYAATCLARHGSLSDIDSAFGELARAMDKRLKEWDEGRGFAAVREDWLAVAHALGEVIDVRLGMGTARGRFAGLAESGALVLAEEGGRIRHVHSGEVSLSQPLREPAA
jgi:BirA family biotin operon repressor/biotin-[acetyl-CoA-carboxylase] ligase